MKYENDPVVKEIRETRKKLFKKFNNNPREYGKFLISAGKKRKAENRKQRKIAA